MAWTPITTTVTSWASTGDVVILGLFRGMPMGLLLALTYADVEPATWDSVSAATTVWTPV